MALELSKVVVCIIRPIFIPLNLLVNVCIAERGLPLILKVGKDFQAEVWLLCEVRQHGGAYLACKEEKRFGSSTSWWSALLIGVFSERKREDLLLWSACICHV